MEVDRRDLVLAHLATAPSPDGSGLPLSALPAAIGVRSNRISERVELVTVLDRLQQEGLVESIHPQDVDGEEGLRCRLTETGRPRAEDIRSTLLDTTIEVVNGDRQELSIAAAATELDQPSVAIAAETTADGVYYRESSPEMGFVGRVSELETARDHLQAAENGDGKAVLVTGPPGVGKTALVDRVVTDARERGLEVCRARARGSGAVPYQPLRDIMTEFAENPFARVGPSVEDPDAYHAQQATLFAEITEILAPAGDTDGNDEDDGTTDSPPARVVAIDDLHLADKGTIAYLRFLLDRLSNRRVLLLGCYRPAELSDDVALTPDATESLAVTHIEVTPFDRDQTRQLLEGVLETREIPTPFVEAVHDRTGGNPLFVEAVVETLLETAQLDPDLDVYPESPADMDVPGEVRKTIDHHVQQFPAPARDLLRWAAVLGEQFDPDVLLALTEVSETQFRTYMELFVDGAVFDRTDAGLVFRSEVLREALLEELPSETRHRWHEQVAAVLDRRDGRDPATVAYHHERAGNHDRAIAAYERAADAATEVYAHETAIDHLRDALALARDTDDQAVVVHLATEVAAIHETVGEYDQAGQYAQFARERATTDRQHVRALERLSGVATAQGDHERAIDLADTGLTIAPEEDAVTCRLLGQKCHAQVGLGRYEAARETAHRRRQIADELSHEPQLAAAYGDLGASASKRGEYETAMEHFEESLTIYRSVGDRHGVAESLKRLGVAAWRQGAYDSAREHFEDSLAMYREVGDSHGVAKTLRNFGILAGVQGDYETATEYFEESLQIDREIGDQHGIAKNLDNLGIVALKAGAHDRAQTHHEESLRIYREIGDRNGVAKNLGNLGLVARDRGDYDRARQYHERSLAIKREIGARRGIAISLSNLGLVAMERGEFTRAQEYHEESLAIEREIEDRHGIATTLGYLGSVARELGEDHRAGEYFEEAAHAALEVGDNAHAGACLAYRATLAFEADDHESGLATGDRALDTVESGGVVTEGLDPVEAIQDLVVAARDTGHNHTAREWCHRTLNALEETPKADGDHREWFAQTRTSLATVEREQPP